MAVPSPYSLGDAVPRVFLHAGTHDTVTPTRTAARLEAAVPLIVLLVLGLSVLASWYFVRTR